MESWRERKSNVEKVYKRIRKNKKTKHMKSIKEKAEEVFPIKEHDSLETELQRRKMRLCYEHGANYVLEEVEKLIYKKRVEGNLSLFDLTHLIDKLKEE